MEVNEILRSGFGIAVYPISVEICFIVSAEFHGDLSSSSLYICPTIQIETSLNELLPLVYECHLISLLDIFNLKFLCIKKYCSPSFCLNCLFQFKFITGCFCLTIFNNFMQADVFLICSNAMQYNAPDTVYFRQV